ncbi:MAG: preprotein translocase subunit SecG [Candidatus Nanopelagicaceae bacterium]
MELAFSILLVITSVLMILLVLLHKGKGSGLSDLFGGGISSTYGGSSVVERNLDRITIVVGGIWFATVIGLSLLLK